VGTGTGDGTIRLDLIDNDSIVDGVGSPLGGPGAGNGSFTGGQAYTVDKTAPAVLQVRSTTPDGSYSAGAAINVTVDFSEPVTLAGGNLRISLDIGVDVLIGPFGPAVSAAGTCVVAAGHNSADLDSLSPLTLSAGTLRDPAGNSGVLGVPAGDRLADLQDIVIDTISPSASMSSAAADPTNASPIPVTVTFSEPVSGFTAGDISAVNGTVGGFAGSGADYSFQLTPSGQGLVSASFGAGTAQDAAGNGSTAAPGFSRTYDSIAPSVTGVDSPAPDGTYGIGQAVGVTVGILRAADGVGRSAPGDARDRPRRRRRRVLGRLVDGDPLLHLCRRGRPRDARSRLRLLRRARGRRATIRDAAGNAAVLTLRLPGRRDRSASTGTS